MFDNPEIKKKFKKMYTKKCQLKQQSARQEGLKLKFVLGIWHQGTEFIIGEPYLQIRKTRRMLSSSYLVNGLSPQI